MDEEIREHARRARRRLKLAPGKTFKAHPLRSGSCCVLLFLLFTAPAFAQCAFDLSTTRPQPATAPAPMPAADVTTAVGDLRNPDSNIRERARAKLLGMSRKDLETLRSVVTAAAPLNASQAVHLREVVIHAFLATEPYPQDPTVGFLGVTLAPIHVAPLEQQQDDVAPVKPDADDLNQPIRPDDEEAPGATTAVIIQQRIPGFCGYKSLETGDVVVGVKDDPATRIASVFQLQTTIRKHPAGDRITLQIVRRGKTIDVPITLNGYPQMLAPLAPGISPEDFRRQREESAENYWNEHFAPLLGQHVS